MVKTHAQPYKHIIQYKYTEQPVSQDSNNTRSSTGE